MVKPLILQQVVLLCQIKRAFTPQQLH